MVGVRWQVLKFAYNVIGLGEGYEALACVSGSFCQTRVISWLDCLAQMPNRSTKEKIKIKKAWENMFSYYGSKSKIVDYYPPPKHKKIIEPFAGSARYSLKYWDNDVLLIDKYDVIVDVWNYLKNATEKDILGLPQLKKGEDLRNFNISDVEMKFLGFLVCGGVESPRYKVASFEGVDVPKDLKRISKNLYKIRHWNIEKLSYLDLGNECATWFIDPPYQFGGQHYKESNKNINFSELSEWCKERNGQVIVCENTKADWLPFKPMKEMQGTMFKTTEAIWSNIKTNYDNEQILLQF